MAAEALKVVIVGHVDHGKSTIVGRLLHDTGSLPDGKLDAIAAASKRRGMAFEWAFLLDALQLERDQGITVDTTQVRLRLPDREIVIIDAPGHVEFVRNMVTGAAQADAALLVVDAAEGVREQTRRHAGLLPLIGHRRVGVLVNKVDLIGCDAGRFAALAAEIDALLTALGVETRAVLPVVARDGDNLVTRSPRLSWYDGPTVIDLLRGWTPAPGARDLPLRLPIQAIYKRGDKRILAGRLESGRLAVGDRLLFSPSNRSSVVVSLEAWPAEPAPRAAEAGQSIGFTLADPIFVERGELASHHATPPVETDVFRARLFWLGREPLAAGQDYRLHLGTAAVPVRVQSIERVVDAASAAERGVAAVPTNAVAEVTLRSRAMLALDDAARLPRTGRFVLAGPDGIVAGGLVSMQGYADQRRALTPKAGNLGRSLSAVTAADRHRRNGHDGGVLWLTGLSAAGKSTLARGLERRLFDRGFQTYVLDGDNLRHGLNADLGFSPEDRAENIRRAGEVAALLAEAGSICVTAFISPYRADRARARAAAGDRFHEIHVAASLAVCEARDPKGLYARARAGQLPDFTGVDAPYEAPDAPELLLDTGAEPPDSSIDRLLAYVLARFRHD